MNLREIKKDLSLIPKFLSKYEQYLKEVKDDMSLENKTIHEACVSQMKYYPFYLEKTSDVKYVLSILEQKLEQIYAKYYRIYNEDYNLNLGERVIKTYITSEKEYQDMNSIVLEVRNLLDHYYGVIKSFEGNGYTLNNLSKILVAQVENTIL